MKLILLAITFITFQTHARPNLLKDWASEVVYSEYPYEKCDGVQCSPYDTCMVLSNIDDPKWSYETETSAEFKSACNIVEILE